LVFRHASATQPLLGVSGNRQVPGRGESDRSNSAIRAFGDGAFNRTAELSDDAARAPELPQTKSLPDRPEYPRPLDPECQLGSRLRDRYRFADARCHPAMTL
jgi:hypothetical protein